MKQNMKERLEKFNTTLKDQEDQIVCDCLNSNIDNDVKIKAIEISYIDHLGNEQNKNIKVTNELFDSIQDFKDALKVLDDTISEIETDQKINVEIYDGSSDRFDVISTVNMVDKDQEIIVPNIPKPGPMPYQNNQAEAAQNINPDLILGLKQNDKLKRLSLKDRLMNRLRR